MKDVKEIISDYLKNNKYDGLFNPEGECACLSEDLQCCGEDFSECFPGIKKTFDQLNEKQKDSFPSDCEFFIVRPETGAFKV